MEAVHEQKGSQESTRCVYRGAGNAPLERTTCSSLGRPEKQTDIENVYREEHRGINWFRMVSPRFPSGRVGGGTDGSVGLDGSDPEWHGEPMTATKRLLQQRRAAVEIFLPRDQP